MTTPELIEYITKQKEKNISKEIIVSKLSASGWRMEDIEEGFSSITNQEITKLPEQQKIVKDPYRESPIEEPKTIKPAFSIQQDQSLNQQVLKEEFIPTLKPKENQGFDPNQMVHNQMAQTISPTLNASSVQYSIPQSQEPVKIKTRGIPKFAFWILGIFIFAVLIGGLVFASSKGLIDLSKVLSFAPKLSFEIPFMKPTPEKAMKKMVEVINKTETAHYVTDFDMSLEIKETTPEDSLIMESELTKTEQEDETINNTIKIHADTYVDNRAKDILKTSSIINAKASVFAGFGVTFDSEVRSIGDTYYFKFPNFGSLLGDLNLPSPNTWISFNKSDIEELNSMSSECLDNSSKEVLTKEKIEAVEKLIDETVFVNQVTEIGKEKLNGETVRHYRVSITKEVMKDFASKILGIIGDEDLLNSKEDLLSQIDEFKPITSDFWIAIGSYKPRKIEITFSTNEFDILDFAKGKLDVKLTTTISDINEDIIIETPSETKSIMDSFHEADKKAKDAALKANVSSMRPIAEMIYDSEKGYGKKSNSTGDCINPEAGSLFSPIGHAKGIETDVGYLSGILKSILEITENKGTCSSTTKAWAVSFPLQENTTKYYCVDSTGFVQETAGNTLIIGDKVPGKISLSTSCQPPTIVNQ
jgi:hypothetical protein